MHVALVTIFSVFAYRNNKKLFWVTLPLVMASFFSTIYLRQHYFVDLLAGWALVFGVYFFLMNPRVEKVLSKTRSIRKVMGKFRAFPFF